MWHVSHLDLNKQEINLKIWTYKWRTPYTTITILGLKTWRELPDMKWILSCIGWTFQNLEQWNKCSPGYGMTGWSSYCELAA
jgi:hypothetical protein